MSISKVLKNFSTVIPTMALEWLALLLLLLSVILWWSFPRLRSSPPGPVPLPFIGHLHLLAKGPAPHSLLLKLAQKYGPVMSLRFGSVPVVVASTGQVAKEFIKKHDTAFANRPPCATGRLLFENCQDLAFAPYGDRWRQLRRICNEQLFNPRFIQSSSKIRMDEVRSLLRSLLASSSRGEAADLREGLKTLAFNHICQLLMGKRYYGETVEDKEEAKQFLHVIDDMSEVLIEFPVGDYIPLLRWMDIGNVEKRFKNISKVTNSLIGRVVSEHQTREQDREAMDFVDLLLKLQGQGEPSLQRRTIKHLLLDLFSAGSDTSAVTLEWAMAELIKHPSAMSKLQEEISEAVGLSSLVHEADIVKLPYLQAVVKESLRLHITVPLLVPHYSSEACTVMGYEIPKGTILLINAYAIGRDPAVWEEPLEFKPERMLNVDVDVAGQHFDLIPFGAGRRICPGMSLGLRLVSLTLANMVHGFNWRLPPGKEPDTVKESYGMTLAMANKLEAVPVPRLPRETY